MVVYGFSEDDCKKNPELYAYAKLMGIPIIKTPKPNNGYLELLEKPDDKYYTEMNSLKVAIDKALDLGDKLRFEKLSKQYNYMLSESK